MKLINTVKPNMFAVLIVSCALFFSCSSSKTVYISNRYNSPVYLVVDSSYTQDTKVAFKDSINGKTIGKKLIIHFGKGKWSKQDKSDLENLFSHSKIIEVGTTKESLSKIKIRHISFDVEELWVTLKKI